MTPEAFREDVALQAVAHYWTQFRRLRRETLQLRLLIVLVTLWCVGAATFAFAAAFGRHGAPRILFQLACAAFDLTVGITCVLRWPRWPKPDPRIPPL